MAKFNKGILGEFSGRVGAVVGSSWRGIPYMKSLPKKRGNSNLTEAQLAHHLRFRMVSEFILSMKDLLTITYRDYANRMTGVNSALAHTIRNAVVGVYPNLNLNYTLALVSRGSLPNVAEVDLDQDPGRVLFNWVDNTGFGNAKADDRAILVVYCPEFKMTVYKLNAGNRSQLQGIVDVPAFRGRSVETWISFMSADGKSIASSRHAGQMVVPA